MRPIRTWILFEMDTPPTNKEIEAIKECLKDSFPGCKEIIKEEFYIKEESLHSKGRSWSRKEFSGLRVVINHIEGLSVILYEKKSPHQYDLVVYNKNKKEIRKTPVTHYSIDRYGSNREWMVSKFGIPRSLNIEKYLNLRKDKID